ncbi:MAG TPA: enoyl-CoA hydratase/isomerase family protein [Actinocrinis sp.]|nr:enoyl-CoA hydratase/isomerase family protein [Actinocrinis sp.]
MSPAENDETLIVRREGRIGRLVLNRPRQINSLTYEMVQGIDRALADWAQDDAVDAVLITGNGERGLCAGGDIRAVYEDARSGRTDALTFWREEYLLNSRIATYPKPYIALMDGITMGGGVGVSAHGSVRIVTERSKVALPEVCIGLVPDVGGTYLLSRAPGELGTHLAVTGDTFGAADALLCGLADCFVPSEQLERLVADLVAADAATAPDVAEIVARHAVPAPEGELAGQREWIDACYRADTVEQILERLAAVDAPAAKEAADRIRGNSPTTVKVTLRAVRQARELGTLDEVLRQEFRISCAGHSSPDLIEGIRAQIIDKDRRPRWSPSALEHVGAEDVERFFAPLGDDELVFPAAWA